VQFAVARSLQAELADAYALLDVIFAHAPVGLALFDDELRYVRVNDRMAAMSGLPAARHLGRPVRDVLPGLPPDVEDDLRRVLDTGEPLVEVDVAGETPARPGSRREWLSSYWPVRPAGGDRISGIGAVVFDVTERRVARRAIRAQADRHEALLLALSEAGQGMVVAEEDGRCVYANAAFEQMTGYTFPELAAMETLFGIVVPEQREEAIRRFGLRMERGWADTGYTVGLRRRDGDAIDLEVAGVPLESGEGRQLVVLARDVTARRRAEAERERILARARLMAEASELFDESPEEGRMLQSVARLCVRDLAESCVVLLGDSPGAVRRVAAAARDPERERVLHELHLRYRFDDDPEHPVVEVLRTGRARVIERLDDAWLKGVAVDERHLGLLRELRVGGAVLVPMRARGAVCGVLALGFASLEYEDRDFLLAVLQDLGRRAALALHSARLHEERSAIARTLQRALLPAALPDIPGIDVAARYRAAGEGDEVGGDFYDCFDLGGGEWAVVIGDVCGRGAEAAAVTALARNAIRAAALRDRRPVSVLRELNEAVLRHGADHRFCTALYLTLSPREDGGADVRLAVGGHPLPLLVHGDGGVGTAGRSGTLLGVLPDPELHEVALPLDAGDALVLFTDGVVESGRAGDPPGSARLSAFLGGCAGQGARRMAAGLERRALEVQHGELRDDLAVVVVRAAPLAPAPFAPMVRGVATRT
jgi:PAS domain S-box-containing protein